MTVRGAAATLELIAAIAPAASAIDVEPYREAVENVEADFYTSTTRPPAVYRGNPFQIEVAMAHGGDIELESSAPPRTVFLVVLPVAQPD